MKRVPHRLPRGRAGVLLVVVAVLLAADFVLYQVSSHLKLTAAVLAAAVVLVVVEHVGLLGPLYALFRRGRSGHKLR
ncbi:MAG TPA: hypothetical protein VM890_13430 [Longimicrobium sp.]|nr:hypothetical protein [Longimicrobium sp.]